MKKLFKILFLKLNTTNKVICNLINSTATYFFLKGSFGATNSFWNACGQSNKVVPLSKCESAAPTRKFRLHPSWLSPTVNYLFHSSTFSLDTLISNSQLNMTSISLSIITFLLVKLGRLGKKVFSFSFYKKLL